MRKLSTVLLSGVMLMSTAAAVNAETVCRTQDVPIYETRTVNTNRNAGADALAGMIIGGIIGKGVTGQDNGAAAGAVIGGIIGANEGQRGSTTRQERVIVGYERKTVCENKPTSRNTVPVGRSGEIVAIYRHSSQSEPNKVCTWEREYVPGHGFADVQTCHKPAMVRSTYYTVIVMINGVEYSDTAYMHGLEIGDWWRLTNKATFNR